MSQGVKHLIKCRCVMPQFKNIPEPPQHQFVVFSVLNNDDRLVTKFAQCNNCGVIHKITDVCKSEITTRENMGTIVSIDDLRNSLPQNLVNILDRNNADLATWEMANFIYENKNWGQFVVLTSDSETGTRSGKLLQLLGENLFKIEQFSREEYAK